MLAHHAYTLLECPQASGPSPIGGSDEALRPIGAGACWIGPGTEQGRVGLKALDRGAEGSKFED